VSSVCDALAIPEDDPRGLTVTGGLPYFGGPGNDYSLHAVASMVERLRERPGSFGFVGANGGILSKYSVGLYASAAAPFVRCDSGPLQAELDARPAVPFTEQPSGRATVESYTVVHGKDGRPAIGVVVARLADGARCLATTLKDDAATVARLLGDADPLGAAVETTPGGEKPNHFVFAA
jgi:acetyl-CoA C-acetyltransferase